MNYDIMLSIYYYLYILFKNKKEDVSITSLKLQIDNKDIERVGTGSKNESFKFVGVHSDENLNWNHHLKAVKNKASRAENFRM